MLSKIVMMLLIANSCSLYPVLLATTIMRNIQPFPYPHIGQDFTLVPTV